MDAFVEFFNYHRFWIMPLALLIVIWAILTVLKDFGHETYETFSDK